MTHLLIDADRIPAKHTAKLDGHRLHVFSKHKKVLKKHQAHQTHRGNVSAEIAGCLKQLLRDDAQARAVVASPRKKVRAAAAALQAVYPDAEVRVWRKLGKKQRARLAARLPETATPPAAEAPTEAVPPAAPLDDAPANEVPPAPAVAESVPPSEAALPDTAGCPTFQAACAFIRKNRPKKKSGLANALGEHLNLPPLAAERLLSQLSETGKIRVDAAENVRYL